VISQDYTTNGHAVAVVNIGRDDYELDAGEACGVDDLAIENVSTSVKARCENILTGTSQVRRAARKPSPFHRARCFQLCVDQLFFLTFSPSISHSFNTQ
jgi:hypothetical protein